MSDQLPTIWETDPHTFAKHQLLISYLNAWVPIMSRRKNKYPDERLLIVDGFAGPGIYADGQLGSPIRILESIIDYPVRLENRIDLIFIELDEERYKSLNSEIDKIRPRLNNCDHIGDVQTKQGDCEKILFEVLNWHQNTNKNIGPAFFFLDQFGYSDVSLNLIRTIMKNQYCEVLSYLNWNLMNPYLSDCTKWATISNAYGNDDWKTVLNLPRDRAQFMQEKYKFALKHIANIKYPWHFAMCDKYDKLIYWMFFCTNNLRGLQEMKKAMWRVDQSGRFKFSDKDNPSQFRLFEYFNTERLADMILQKLDGRILNISKIEEIVLTETPAYNFAKSLALLEKNGALLIQKSPPGRKKGSFLKYKTDLILKFQKCQS